MFCWLIFVHVFTFIFRCSSKKLFCWLIFVHVFTLTISLKGALFTCTYESNQSIEWTNRINEWKQWIEALNRTNESNQWIESLSRETRQEAVTIHIRWLSKPVLESHHIDLLLWIPNPPSVRVFCWDNFVCFYKTLSFSPKNTHKTITKHGSTITHKNMSNTYLNKTLKAIQT